MGPLLFLSFISQFKYVLYTDDNTLSTCLTGNNDKDSAELINSKQNVLIHNSIHLLHTFNSYLSPDSTHLLIPIPMQLIHTSLFLSLSSSYTPLNSYPYIAPTHLLIPISIQLLHTLIPISIQRLHTS